MTKFTIEGNTAYAISTVNAPIGFSKVKNPAGYLDLYVNKHDRKNMLRISNGKTDLFVANDKVEELISALRNVKARGVSVAKTEVPPRS